MLRISSQLTRTERTDNGDTTEVPVVAFYDGFFWPPEGIDVPDGWLRDEKLEQFLDNWIVLVEQSTGGDWETLSKRVRSARGQDTGGPPLPDRPGPSSDGVADAKQRGIIHGQGDSYHVPPPEPDPEEETVEPTKRPDVDLDEAANNGIFPETDNPDAPKPPRKKRGRKKRGI